ncbi:hypothetical protein [Nocardia acidivorans]|uniref:hypothetical protein n=1 Tax=Nocardia acidivorans TaxID=404580 RepID=UPI000832855E|nr:hypothetical protein [Nocardia acidivorans]
MRIHVFSSSGEAYDHSQWREDIKDGDLLFVPSETIAGWLLGAWPVAATEHRGEFHTIDFVAVNDHSEATQLRNKARQVRATFIEYLDEDWAWDLNALYDAKEWESARL